MYSLYAFLPGRKLNYAKCCEGTQESLKNKKKSIQFHTISLCFCMSVCF